MKLEKENTTYINTPEFVILELIDRQIDMLEKDINQLEKLKSDVYYMIKDDCEIHDWSDIYMRLKEGTR